MKIYGLLLSIGLLFTLTLNQVMACSLELYDHGQHSDCHETTKSKKETKTDCDHEGCLHSCCHLKMKDFETLTHKTSQSFTFSPIISLKLLQIPKNILTEVFRPPIS